MRRWLAAYGPGTEADLRWWTGWTAAQVRAALAAVAAVEVDLGGAPGLLLPDDLEPVPPAEPWVALLPALDPTVMGWSGRDWYLGEHGPALFDRSGNAGPTVWCDGRVVGGWAQLPSGAVAHRLLEDIGELAIESVEAKAAELTRRLGAVRITPRFRTPLERALIAGSPG
ncbi:MAG: DNA glycosylase AlkZ-like family protein, partial [Candidatus Dormibacteria bacterium]